mgnify:FL=1
MFDHVVAEEHDDHSFASKRLRDVAKTGCPISCAPRDYDDACVKGQDALHRFAPRHVVQGIDQIHNPGFPVSFVGWVAIALPGKIKAGYWRANEIVRCLHKSGSARCSMVVCCAIRPRYGNTGPINASRFNLWSVAIRIWSFVPDVGYEWVFQDRCLRKSPGSLRWALSLPVQHKGARRHPFYHWRGQAPVGVFVRVSSQAMVVSTFLRLVFTQVIATAMPFAPEWCSIATGRRDRPGYWCNLQVRQPPESAKKRNSGR